ncbi:hypothetical protein ACFV3T_02085 [Streptomyces albidoflavus]
MTTATRSPASRRSARAPPSPRSTVTPAARPCRPPREFPEFQGHTLVVTSDKEGPDSELDRELADADVVMSQPFWPAYLTAERIARAPKVKLALTAGIGSDHVDLDAAIARSITVAEVTYSNSISVAEHAVMQILALGRNYLPSHKIAAEGGWNIADCVAAPPQALGRPPPLHRQAPAPARGRGGAGPDLPRDGAGPRPHICGTTLTAQARYAAGTREILEDWLKGTPIREEYLIVDGGRLAGTGAASYTAGEKN